MEVQDQKLAGGGLLKKAAKAIKFEANPNWALNTTNIGLPTPGIMIPSKMSEVREAVRNIKGNYGARRVERAADAGGVGRTVCEPAHGHGERGAKRCGREEKLFLQTTTIRQ